jgi:hypothetical protein
VPEHILGVLPFIYISHSRLAAFLLPKFYSTARRHKPTVTAFGCCGTVTSDYLLKDRAAAAPSLCYFYGYVILQAALPWGLEAVKNFAWRTWWGIAAFACKVTLG